MIAAKLERLEPFGIERVDNEKLEVIECLMSVARNVEATPDDFDEAMELLYDWGDSPLGARRKTCWIKWF